MVENANFATLCAMCNGGSSSGNNVFIRGQGDGQGVVKMEESGKIIFADGAPGAEGGELFVREPAVIGSALVYTFENGELYISGNTDDYTVCGQTSGKRAYWKQVRYSIISGNIKHFNNGNMNGGVSYCLQYWGDIDYRTNYKDGLFLAADGSESDTRFTLVPYETLKQQGNGIFAFTYR